MEKGKEKGASRGNADAERIWAKPPLEVFLEDGRAGLKNRDGEVVLVPVWGQVEIRGECVAARDNGFEDRFWRDGRSGSTILSEDNHFYRNGKVGLLKDGKVWFDAVYDEIDDWSEAGFDVVYTRIGQTPAYFTGDHRPVLTQWRRFPDLQGEEEPYYVWEKQHSPVLVTMERGGGPDDAQSCRLKDGFVHLDRMRKSEVLPMFSAGSQVRKENAHRLAEFECAFTYIYSAYAARAKGPDAVEECFKDFAWMDCFESSWARLILVSVSPGRKAPLDVRVLVRGSAAVPEWEPTGDFAVGFDESLEEDEVRVFMVQYFADHWPSQMEFHVGYELDSYVPARIRAAADEWRRFVEDAGNFTSEEGQAAYRLEASRPLEPSPVVPAGRSWKSIERVCRMLLDGGATLRRFASEICGGCIYLDESEIVPIFGNQVRLLEWALAHGSNPNEVDWDGTCLDALESHLAWLESRPKEKALPESLALTRELRARILAAGGKRRAELLADRTPVWLAMP